MGKLRTLSILQLFVLFSVLSSGSVACANSQIWTAQGQESGFEALSDSLKTRSVIILGENHGLKTHQNQHLEVLNTLRKQGRVVHVGLEFFSYTYQNEVDSYRRNEIPEADFLKKIEWGGTPFDFYKAQATFPDYPQGERTWALNAPRALTSQISKSGVDLLSPELKELLPPNFGLGQDAYRKRFVQVIGDHVKDPKRQQDYFEAQSAWDDTMAWRIQTFQQQNPDAVLVVVVGDFHVQYGGGLPDRLNKRGVRDYLVISQVNTSGLSEQEIQKQVLPDIEYGPRADWIWTAPAVD